jgi:hypothetical protein
MTAAQQLAEAIKEFELIHQRKPKRLIVTWEVRAELERAQALPDYEIVNCLNPFRTLRVE